MDILIDTDAVLRDFVLNRHEDLRKTFKLRKPAFADPALNEQNVDALFNHSHPLLTEIPQRTTNPPIDLATIAWERVNLPEITNLPRLQFPRDIQLKKRIFLNNLKHFPTSSDKINLLSAIKEDVAVERKEPVAVSEEKKQAAEFLRMNLKSSDSDFATLVKSYSLKMSKGTYKWAHLVPSDKEFIINPRDMALKLDFKLDTFQAQAIHYLTAHKNVFVAAHTSSGKTVIAEYAIALSDLHNTNTIYTSPIKALSNQKYRDFSKKFSKQKIGLITGDVQINVNYEIGGASSLSARQSNSDCSQPNICTIMTTEILLTMLYRNEKFLKNVEFVVFDEAHYINDASRGYVWEEIFILLPSHITIVMLSATIPNLMEFNEWIGELKSRDIYIVKTERRPIPLEYYVIAPQYLKLKKADKGDQQQQQQGKGGKSGIKGEVNIIRSPSLSTQTGKDPFCALIHCTAKPTVFEDYKLSSFNSEVEQEMKKAKGRPQFNYLHTVRFLSSVQKLPAVVFVLSRKRCDDLARDLDRQNVNLLNSESERHFVDGFLKSQLGKLTKSIGGGAQTHELPLQVHEMKSYLLRGFACHHSGLLQSLKEIVELLFQMGYVKLLFATETFAIGVNMPTRTVVFDAIDKFDGRGKRLLTPVEFTQMAGRAGRRGQDDFGTVLMLIRHQCYLPTELRQLCLTNIEKVNEITTKFQLNYKLILNVIRTNELPDPKKEDYKTVYQGILKWDATWKVKPPQTELLSNSTLSIEKFLKFNFFEYQRTLKGAKLDNFRVEMWQLFETLLHKRFFGYFDSKRSAVKTRTFFEDCIRDNLVIPPWDSAEKSVIRENLQLELVILHVELQRFRNSFWGDFLVQNASRFFKNGRLIRLSTGTYDHHFAICINGATKAKKLNVLIYRNMIHSNKAFEDWMAASEEQDEQHVKKLIKFLNRFGCPLWNFREGRPIVDLTTVSDDDEDEKWLKEDWTDEDRQLLEIYTSFMNINPRFWQKAMENNSDNSSSFIDWKNVARMVYNSSIEHNTSPESVWWEGNSTLEPMEVELKDVETIYELFVLPKHDLADGNSSFKIKSALEKEVTEKGGISQVDSTHRVALLDELHLAEVSEEHIKYMKSKLAQQTWIQGRIKELRQNNNDLLMDTFIDGGKATRYLELCRSRYEPKLLSDKYNLEHLEFYGAFQKKLAVLQQLDYVKPDTQELTLKGRMASELANQKLPNELLLTEIIFNYFVVDLNEAELCALLSCTLCTAKINDDQLTALWVKLAKEHPKLLADFQSLEKIFQNVQRVEKDLRVDHESSGEGELSGDLNCNLILVVYEWAQGKSFVEIKAMTEIQDGIIVRCIQNLIELLRDIRNAAHSVGEPVLFNKINAAITLIKRDIIFAPSLYTL